MTLRHKTVAILLVLLIAIAMPAFPQANTDEYYKTIESADSYFSKGDYINAKASYQIAVRLAPEEQYPKDRLQQSLDMIKVQMYQTNLYTQKIQVADEMFRNKDFTGAIQYYQEALSILPGDVYASGKIQEINRTQVDATQQEANYQKSIAAGDQFFKEGKLDKALIEYKNATALKPAEPYAKQKAIETEALIAQKKNITDEYLASMQAAELAISRNNYEEAIKNLEKAINLMPGEPLPKQKLAEAQSLKAAWDSYNSIITAADDYYVNKDFQLAKDKYLQAQSIKPGDDYPKRMLEKIDIAMMDVEQANRSSYEFVIQKADELYSQQDYEKAMVEYQKALLFKPDETYAKQRINDINNALNLRKSQEEAYTQAIARADLLFREEKYTEAKAEFNRAIGIKPLEQYPKVKIEEINTILTDLSTKRELYTNLIKGADRLFFSDEYEEAREQYRQASYLFPKEKYPLDQITMINEILGQRDTYVKAVTRADQLFYEQDFEAALMEFRTAAALQPEEEYPQEKIKEIEALLADAQIATEEKRLALEEYNKEQVFEFNADTVGSYEMQKIENGYWDLIAQADEALAAKDYQKALTDYEASRELKPGEIYAQGKISQINTILADLAAKELAAKELAAKEAAAKELAAKEALEKQYAEAVAAADKSLTAKDYQKALSGYRAALSLKPQATYPSEKIAEINNTLAEIAAAELAAKEAAAKELAAKEAAAKKLAEEELAAKEAAAKELADKEALEKQYNDAIATADAALQAKDYQAALSSYQAASSLKPEATYPSEKIAEINTTLDEIAAAELAAKEAAAKELAAKEAAAKKLAEEELAAKEALEKQYNDAIATADAALQAKDYQASLSSYQAAASLKPQATYPSEKITEINTTLAEIAAAELAAKEAEAKELAAKEAAAKKLAEEELAAREALEKQYNDAIATADAALASKNYQNALTAYESAASLKPQATYPSEKITEINTTLAEIAAAELAAKEAAAKELAAKEAAAKKLAEEELAAKEAAAKELAAKEALEKQYNDAIATADAALASKDYQNALTAYENAASLKPQATYPSEKITEINTTLAEIAAAELAAKEAAAKEAAAKKLAEEELAAKEAAAKELAAKEALEKQYNDAIATADAALASKDYQNALTAYENAAGLKPQATYPSGKITEINTTLAEIAAQELAVKEAAAKELAAKEAAAKKLAEEELAAKEAAAKKLAEEELAAKEAAAKEVAAKEALEKQYNDAIAMADAAVQAKDYQAALTSYQAASSLKPDEQYAQSKVLEVRSKIAEQAKQLEIDKAYVSTIAAADEYMKNNQYEEARSAYQAAIALKPAETYPGKQIIQIDHTLESMAAEREQAFQSAISKADISYGQKDYEMAQLQYSRALELKPDDANALQKLTLVNEQLAIKKQLVEQEYNKTIIDADKFFASKTYDNAIESYRAAAILKPDEAYPEQMVSMILKILSERSIVQINKNPLLIPNNTLRKFDFVPVPAKDRKSNYIYFTARNLTDKEYKLIISFGEGQSKNGGVVVKVPPGQSNYEFIVRISAQYKWFSDDNNWISFYPEGGDIEVSLMQISYSD